MLWHSLETQDMTTAGNIVAEEMEETEASLSLSSLSLSLFPMLPVSLSLSLFQNMSH